MSINTRLFLVSLFSIILTFSFSHTALAAAPISTTISGSVTWTKAGGPYLVSSIYIPTGSSLTIEPGSVIYVSNGAYAFNVSGSLRIGAVNAERTLVTSENNITGGLPNIGDWKSILVNSGGSLTITNTDITYGGMPVSCGCGGLNPLPLIENDGGIVTLDQVALAQMQSYGLMQTSGTTTITNSIIKDASHGAFVTGGMFELASTVFSNIGTYNAAIYAGEFVNGGGNRGGTGFFVGNIKKGSSVWVGDDVPYVIANLQIPANASLTINPGATVKIVTDAYGFFVSGELNIGASSTLPVIITSITDDTVLGDTNNDGNATVAAPGIWKTNVITPGAYAHIINTEIRYGGGFISCGCGGLTGLSLIENDGGVLLLDHAVLSQSKNDAIEQKAGTTTVMHTTFSQLARNGATELSGYMNVSNDSFNQMQTGIFSTGGTLEFFHNTFSSISGYGAEVYSTFINHGSNSGSAILLRQAVRTNSIISKDNIPYIVKSIYVYSGAVLTIGPGAVLKILPDAYFAIEGTLNMGSSSSTDKTIITSIKDDSILGDTNGDGSTTPLAGDWPAIRFEAGSKGTLLNTIIHYGGGTLYDSTIAAVTAFPMIKNRGGNLILDNVTLTNTGNYGIYQTSGGTTITHSEIADSVYYGVLVTGGTMSIHSTSIHNNQGYGVFNSSAANIVDATNNWWGAFGGPTHASNPFGSGDRVSDNVDYEQWLTEEPQGTCVVNCFSNVLFLPGVMGSNLYDLTGNRVWLSDNDAEADYLHMNASGTSEHQDITTKDAMSTADGQQLNTNIYKSFLLEMKSWETAYGITATTTPYDWRLDYESNVTQGRKLTNGTISYLVPPEAGHDSYVIETLKQLASTSKTGKVTIIAHSQGGLLTKALTNKLGVDASKYIDKIIFIATPQLGTPEAVARILLGTDAGITGAISNAKVRDLAQHMQSASNLLPSAEYFHYVDDPVITIASSTLPDWSNPYVTTIHSSQGVYNFMADIAHTHTKPAYADLTNPEIVDQPFLDRAKAVHDNLDHWLPPRGVQLTVIAGWGEETLSGIDFKSERSCVRVESVIIQSRTSYYCAEWGGKVTHNSRHVIDGDGTVLEPSALWLNGAISTRYWVDLLLYNSDWHIDRDHKNILEVPQLRTLLANILTGSTASLPTYLSNTAPQYTGNIPRLHFTLHSPLSLEFYDLLGNHVGYSTTTGLVDHNIPGVRYERYGDVQWLSVPKELKGKLMMHGTGSGSFALDVEEVNGNKVIVTTSFEEILSSTSTVVTMNITPLISATGSSTLVVDQDGNGTTDLILQAKQNGVVTPPIFIPDTTPPTTTATTTGTLGKNGWYTSNVLVTLTATDTESGVASTTYSLNSGVIWSTYTAPITITQEGSTTILYRSTDKAGNREATNTLVIKIDKAAPEVRMVFDPTTQLLKITGIDSLSSTTVVTTATSSLITDQAGHALQILITQAKPKTRRINVLLTKLLYDGVATSASISLKYKWNTNTDGTYKLFAAHIASSTVLIETHFRPKENQTILMTTPIDMDDSDTDDSADARATKTSLPGMIVEGLVTNRGKINVWY